MLLRNWLVIFGILMLIFPLSSQAAETKETPASLPGVKIVDTDTVKKWLDEGEDVFILDARKAPDYEAGHLPESENCTVPSDLNVGDEAIQKSMAALDKCESLEDLEKDVIVVTYCNNFT